MSAAEARAAGITAIAALFLAAAVAAGVLAAGTAAGRWPLAWGRFLVGDMAIMGPAVFALACFIHALAGWGLLRMKIWARRLAIVVAGIGLYFLVPEISAAVADLRLIGIVTGGGQIIVRVIVLWYLLQPVTAESFAAVSKAAAE